MSVPKKVTLLTDSLSLTRLPGEENRLPLEQTYPYLLDQRLREAYGTDAPIINDRGMRARTVIEVISDWSEEVLMKEPQLTIVHVGIADCAPRIFSRRQHRMIQRIPWDKLRCEIIYFVRRHRRKIIKLRPACRYVSEKKFHEAVHQLGTWAKREGASKLMWINIIRPSDEMEMRSPGFQAAVDAYNEILGKYVDNQHIYLYDFAREVAENGASYLAEDGIHLSEAGHLAMSEGLLERMKEILQLEPAGALA